MTTSQSGSGFWHRRLLRLDPERAHDLALAALRLASSTPPGLNWLRRRFSVTDSGRLEQQLLGRKFANPVGLAAGFDKNGRAMAGLSSLGFGFLEIGTVTPKPQRGNPKPRIFRHPEHESLRNALGFNNAGMVAIHRRVSAGYPYRFPIGVNVGKNASTPLEDAESDYEALFRQFANCTDYFVINVSSPNTPGLRDLQAPARVAGLLEIGRRETDRPLLVKLSADLEIDAVLETSTAAVAAGAAGIIVTNTTTDYRLIPGADPTGGLSGGVLRQRSFEILEELARELYGKTMLVSVGGIDSGDEIFRRLRAGASLVQLYTALVYRGPTLVSDAIRRLDELMEQEGFESVSDTIGVDVDAG